MSKEKNKHPILKTSFRIVFLPLMGMALILLFAPIAKPFPKIYDNVILGTTMMANLMVDLALFASFYHFGLLFLDMLEWFAENMNIIIEMIKEYKEINKE